MLASLLLVCQLLQQGMARNQQEGGEGLAA
jgi:hypothetical protein